MDSTIEPERRDPQLPMNSGTVAMRISMRSIPDLAGQTGRSGRSRCHDTTTMPNGGQTRLGRSPEKS
jgi:hypothetical protein